MNIPPRLIKVTDADGNRTPLTDTIEEVLDEQRHLWVDEVFSKISELHLNLILYGKTTP
jgi:hypothetical protein